MKCGYCGSMMPERARACDQCGAPVALTFSRARDRESVQHPHLHSEGATSWGEPTYQQRRSLVNRVLDPPRGPRAMSPYPPAYMPVPVRSFRLNAVIAFVLYFPFFLPGLIASAVWWREAKAIERHTGFSPPGKGCLTALLLWGMLVVGFWVLVFAAV